MAKVIVAPTAAEDLRLLIERLHLPSDTRSRVRDRLSQLARFPESGEELAGRWQGFRCVLGPWRWMLIVVSYDQNDGQVNVVTVQDSRAAESAKSKWRRGDGDFRERAIREHRELILADAAQGMSGPAWEAVAAVRTVESGVLHDMEK